MSQSIQLTGSEKWVLMEAFEAKPDSIFVSLKGDKHVFEHLEELKLLKRVLLRSGYHPEFKYAITAAGIQFVNIHRDELP
jgi:hypothetical protein